MEPGTTTEKKTVARCGIYEQRPEACKVYPKLEHPLPKECTYTFMGSDRRGDCACEEGACCTAPRAGGEPEGEPLSALEGGRPCKNLVWKEIDVPMEKKASGHPSLPVFQPDIYDLVGGPRDT